MRITGLGVGGFGLLAELNLDNIGPGTTVVCGPNEAGKSTLHTFVVRTLFGHPRINDTRDRRRHEPLVVLAPRTGSDGCRALACC